MTAFVEKQLHLLEIEHLAEVEEKNFEASNLSTKILQRSVIICIFCFNSNLYESKK